ncbi:MAG: hypothetical protein PUE21_04525 [Lachnospiraceae bacterium]|nr:hypothetical protein [Lachnospiraceae bacterium]
MKKSWENNKKVCSNYLTPEGIVNGNDPFLYGEKLKAQLIRFATPLPGERIVPNEKTGYGKI